MVGSRSYGRQSGRIRTETPLDRLSEIFVADSGQHVDLALAVFGVPNTHNSVILKRDY